MPNKTGADFITIRSVAADAQLPAPGERLDPAKYADALPKLIGNVAGEPVVNAASGAHHFRFVAVEFGPTVGGQGNIIQLGTGHEESVDALPHDIEFDRCEKFLAKLALEVRKVCLGRFTVALFRFYFDVRKLNLPGRKISNRITNRSDMLRCRAAARSNAFRRCAATAASILRML